jgi:TPR repeat protein
MHGKYGLPKDVELAKAFMKSAAKQGHAGAIKALKVLGRCAMELEPGQCVACGAPDITRTCLGCRQDRYFTLACQDQD